MDNSQDTHNAPDTPTEAFEPDPGTPSSPSMEVDVGNAMPPSQPSKMPVLQSAGASTELNEGLESGQARSMVAEGMHFVGNAELRGPCSVAGAVDGNLTQAMGALVAVVVTETGRVKGDITAQKISVMGHTDGVLDSGEGEVSLHDTASVHGLVRYGRIQVNGADLNATLERATVKKTGT
ncbi:polymer-forming cytoskeletal protein [Hydrogenophaga sp. PAMC20947]|uniref:bactofilin family protein n=1 Tax=Hydrogenophaga sp. PAMC20947 TaxID=2565558 RepID=UPI001B3476B1|nr:polymer-forming cytoskeletal protein [Hydrogenophaga sp. PAMC20947]